jgi:UDP-2,3-diacylglucosamine hydrolase
MKNEPTVSRPVRIVVIGAGNRANKYLEYARRYAAEHDVDHFVFGHMHFPRDYREQSLHVINLGCWEKYPSCAVLDASGGMTLKMLER